MKTPIPFLLLCAVGVSAAARAPPGTPRHRLLEPALIALAILVVSLPSRINIGVRHVLPIYPFRAITAAPSAAA